MGGADHHRRQHDPLLYILFSADGRTTSSSLYISLKFPWKFPGSCQISTLLIVVWLLSISTLLIVVWLLSIIVVWLLSSLFSPDMQPSLASACANEIQISSALLCLFFMTSSDWCSSSSMILEEEEFFSREEGCCCFCFAAARSGQQVYYYYILFPSTDSIKNEELNLSCDLSTSWWVG